MGAYGKLCLLKDCHCLLFAIGNKTRGVGSQSYSFRRWWQNIALSTDKAKVGDRARLELVLWLPLTVMNEVYPLVTMEWFRLFKSINLKILTQVLLILIMYHTKKRKEESTVDWLGCSFFFFLLFLHCEMPAMLLAYLLYLFSVACSWHKYEDKFNLIVHSK